jgi:cell division protein FtsQ
VSGLAATLTRGRLSFTRSLPALSPRLKRRLLALAALSLVLVGGFQFWLRDSSLVAVEEVKISGLTTDDAPRVRIALANAAEEMTTLHVDRERLDRVVEAYPVVRELKVTPDFPHGLRVEVVEHVAAAMAVSDSGQVPVAGDGTLLRGLPVEGRLPTIAVEGVLGGDRLRDGDGLAAAAVAGAAPALLRRRIDKVSRRSDDGLVAELGDGPVLIFGSAAQLHAKWAAAARVLADPDAKGASYVDLRIPGRPAAGGLPAETVTPVAPAGMAPQGTAPPAGAAATDPNAAQPADPTLPVDPSLPADPATGATTGEAPQDPTATTPTSPPMTTTPPPATTPGAPQPLPAGGVEGGAAAPTAP